MSEYQTVIVRLPTACYLRPDVAAILENLCQLGLDDIAKDAIWQALHVYRWCEGVIHPIPQMIEKHFDYAEFWEWLSDRYDDPYQLALCRQRSIHDVALNGMHAIMTGLLYEWQSILPLLPFSGGAYANVVELRSDSLEATIWFEYSASR